MIFIHTLSSIIIFISGCTLQYFYFIQYLDCRKGCILQSEGHSDCESTCVS